MHEPRRAWFNARYSEALALGYQKRLEAQVGPFPFRLAETPLFVDERLRSRLMRSAEAIAAQLCVPAVEAELRKAIPARVNAPGQGSLPDCVQVDFALVRGEDGELTERLVELQAFPSLYALEMLMADAWAEVLEAPELSCFFDVTREQALGWLRHVIVGEHDPFSVALLDVWPDRQKTAPDFRAHHALLGVSAVCPTTLLKQGNKLYRSSGGRLIPVERIYNRMVFDELDAKQVQLPFSFTDELDVSWCSHPNWYWMWSKYSLPFLDHPAVPKTRFLPEVFADGLPESLENFVLKPLFSFAGSGVNIDLTREALLAIPEERRGDYLLQEKFEYAPAITMPAHASGFDPLAPGVKAECRVMLLRDDGYLSSSAPSRPLRAMLVLVRTSRGKMLGVDQNRGAAQAWSGGTVALFG